MNAVPTLECKSFAMPSVPRICFDLLPAQTPNSRNRGLGNYALGLCQALSADSRSKHLYTVAAREPVETLDEIERALHGWIPRHRQKLIDLPSAPIFHSPESNLHAALQAASLDWAYARINPDILHLPSIMEPQVSFPFPLGAAGGIKSASLADLIPLVFSDVYLKDERYRAWYRSRLDYYQHFDVILAISESARQDAIRHLGIKPDRIFNTSMACDPRYCAAEVPPEERVALMRRYGLARSFLLYTGGGDWRKNLPGAIRAYAALPAIVRQRFCFAVVCSLTEGVRNELNSLAAHCGLCAGEVVMTGFVPDCDLVGLYRTCYAFVFPSLYEGFGLPPLEAMACGAATIAANNSSLVEVVGLPDALFDASSDDSITRKMNAVLTDEGFRRTLREHAAQQARRFTWSATAARTLDIWQEALTRRCPKTTVTVPGHRRRLAMLTPLPPDQSGIADYSTELITPLNRHFQVDVFCAEPQARQLPSPTAVRVLDVATFPHVAKDYDVIVYQIGNSAFHGHMFELLRAFPGVVVLHDFFLSGIVNHLQHHRISAHALDKEILSFSGPAGLGTFQDNSTALETLWSCPANREIFDHALGVIVHSAFSLDLVRRHFPEGVSAPMKIVSQLRSLNMKPHRNRGQTNEFVICTFGHVTWSKLPDLILEAYEALAARSPRTHLRLVFVGELNLDEQGREFAKKLHASPARHSIKVTGYASLADYEQWLERADLAIQLRSVSRGETSRAVLDCLAHGLPLIVNRYAGFTDYANEEVWFTSEAPTVEEVAALIQRVLASPEETRQKVGAGIKRLRDHHAPAKIADGYREAIETFSADARPRRFTALTEAAMRFNPADAELNPWIDRLIESQPVLRRPRLFYDVTLFRSQWNDNYRTGIQRVVASLLPFLQPATHDFWPVELTADLDGYQAVFFGNDRLMKSSGIAAQFQAGDIVLIPELRHTVDANQPIWRRLLAARVEIHAILYDMLPIILPQFFNPGAIEVQTRYASWLLETVDAVHAISLSSADEFRAWARTSPLLARRDRPLRVGHFKLGCDPLPVASVETPPAGIEFTRAPMFLMVGTIEPRKGHDFVLDAFDACWAEGMDLQLCFIGRQGWMCEACVDRIRKHPEHGRRLHFLENASDAVLTSCYRQSAAIINASAGEGYGLPLVEAARQGLPVLASDLPVFREVCGEGALYFSREVPLHLIECIRRYMRLKETGRLPDQTLIQQQTWEESARSLLDAIFSARTPCPLTGGPTTQILTRTCVNQSG